MNFPRFTIRRLMLAVAISGFLLFGWTTWLKRSDYLSRAEQATARCKVLKYSYLKMSSLRARLMVPQSEVDDLILRLDHHRHLVEKYNQAARIPWIPVAPDPPEPG